MRGDFQVRNSSLRTNEEISQIYERHVDTVYRVCFMYMKNEFDTDDMVAETFCKLINSNTFFESFEHEKAWLIRVASNLCKNRFRHWWNKTTGIEDAKQEYIEQRFEIDETLEKVRNLPQKYKTAIYLHYYEGYSAVEIARLFKLNESTVYGHLHKGRKLLKIEMEDNI